MKNSIKHLMKLMRKFYVTSIGFDGIYFGSKNPKRFRKCVLICALIWMFIIQLILIFISDYLYSLVDNPFLPDHFRTFLLLTIIGFLVICVGKTDLLLGEIKYNLDPLKIFYYLMKNMKSKHKLNDKNYKKLAIFIGFVELMMLDYGMSIIFLLSFLFSIKISILSRNWMWIWAFSMAMIPTIILCCVAAGSIVCIIIIIFAYYKMVFDQINDKIELIC